MEKWIEKLEEAIKCDPDYGDPYVCLEDVKHIIDQMKKEGGGNEF